MKSTPLHRLQKVGSTLKSPFSRLSKLSLSSWVNDLLPDVLWSALIATHLPREKAIATFKVILLSLKHNPGIYRDRMLSHSSLREADHNIFDTLFGAICVDSETRRALSPLLAVESLPDKHHWVRHLEVVEAEESYRRLAETVTKCFDHQSQASTDCRWFRVMTLFAQDRLVVNSELENLIGPIINYPNEGDMRSIRPRIRSLEMVTRSLEPESKPYNEPFWDEMWKGSDCFVKSKSLGEELKDRTLLFKAIRALEHEICAHFIDTVESTNIDPRHDASFGLVLYTLQLLLFSLAHSGGQTMIGRIALRSAAEVYISLSYLTMKDNPTIWLQFRNYGNGQIKLAYLKNIDADQLPSFIKLEDLEALANEDIWSEFMDIKLGAWDGKDLRKMAVEAGVKEFYDRHYDVLSGYVHGNWSAVRQSVFGQCLNPLHRFHRIPLLARALSDDAVPDMVKVLNLSLDRLSRLYPPFKPRLHADRDDNKRL